MDGAYPYWDAYVSGLLSEDDSNNNNNSCSISFGSHPHDNNDDNNNNYNNNKEAWKLIQSRRQLLKPVVRLKNFSKKGPPKQIKQEEYLRLIKRKGKSHGTSGIITTGEDKDKEDKDEDDGVLGGCDGNIIRWPEVFLQQKNLYTFTYHDDPMVVDTRGGGGGVGGNPKDKSSPSPSSLPLDIVPSYVNEFKAIRDYKTGMVGSFRPSSAPVPESKHPYHYRYHSGVNHKKLYYEADSIGDENAPDELVHVLSDNLFEKYHGLLDDSDDDNDDDDDDKKKHGDGNSRSNVAKKTGIGVMQMVSHHVTGNHGAGADVNEPPDQSASDEVGNGPYNSNKYDYGGGGDTVGNHGDKIDGGGGDNYNMHRLKSDHFKNLYRPKTAPELLTPGVALTGVIQYKKKSSSPSSPSSPPPSQLQRPMSKVKSDLESAMRFDSFHLRNFDKAVMVDDKKPSSLYHTHVCNVRIPLSSSPTMKTISSPTMSPSITTTLKEHRPLQFSGPPAVTITSSAGHKKKPTNDVNDKYDYKNDYNNDFTPEKLRIKRSQPDFSPERLRKRYPSRVASKLINAINGSSRRVNRQHKQQEQEQEVEEMNTSYNHRMVTTVASNLAPSTTVVAVSAVVATAAGVDTSNAKQTDRKNSENDVAIIEAASSDRSKDDGKKQVSIRDILNDKELFRKPLYPYISLNAARATRQWESKRSTAEALLESYKSSINSTTTGQVVNDNTNAVEKSMKKMISRKKKKKTMKLATGTSPSQEAAAAAAVVMEGSSPLKKEEEKEEEKKKEILKEAVVINNIASEDNYFNMECQEIPITTTLAMSVIADVTTFVVTAITETKHPNNSQESMLTPINDTVSNSLSAIDGTVPQAMIDYGTQATVDEEVGQKNIAENILPPSGNEQHSNSFAAIITAWNVQNDINKSIISDTSSYHDEFELIWSSLMDVKGDNDDVKNVVSTIGGDVSIITIKEDITDDKDAVDDIILTQSDLPFLTEKISFPATVSDVSMINSVVVDNSLYNLVKDDVTHEESIDRVVIPSSMDVLVHVKSSNQILREKIESLKRKPSMRKGPSSESLLNRTEESSLLNRSEVSMDDRLDTSSEPVTSRSSPHRKARLGNDINNDNAPSILSEKVLQQQMLVSETTIVESIHQGKGPDESDVHPPVDRSEEPVTVIVESGEVAVVSDTSIAPFSLTRSIVHPMMDESSIALVSAIDKTEFVLNAVEFDTPLFFGGSEEVVFEHLLSDEIRISNDDALYMEEFDMVTSDSLDYNDSSFLQPEDFDISMDKSVDQNSLHQQADELKDTSFSAVVVQPLDETYKEDLNEFFIFPEGNVMDESNVVIVESKKHFTPSEEHESNAPEFIVSSTVEFESEVPAIVVDESEVRSIAKNESQMIPIAEDKSPLAPLAEDESVASPIAKNESEAHSRAENKSEVVPIAQHESEVASIAENESQIDPIAEDKSPLAPLAEDESEVPPLAGDESEAAPIAENNLEVVLKVENKSAVAPPIESFSEIHLKAEDESEVVAIAESAYEVAHIAENESAVAPIAEDESEVALLEENESEVASITEKESEIAQDESEVESKSEMQLIAENKSEVVCMADNESEVVPIAEEATIAEDEFELPPIVVDESFTEKVESEVVPIAEDVSEVVPIAEDVSEVAPIAVDESEVVCMADNESEVVPIAENESEVAPIAEVESEIAPIVVDESEVAQEESEAENKSEILPHIAENESEVVCMADNESEVVPKAEDVSEIAQDESVVESKSEMQLIAENKSEVVCMADNESEVVPIAEEAPIAEDEFELPPIVVDESEVAPIAEDDSEVVPIAENESAVAQEESEVEKKSEILPHIAENESEVVCTADNESEVVPIAEDVSEIAQDESVVESKSEMQLIAENESEVVCMADNESEVVPIAEDEYELPPIVVDESEVVPIAEDDSEVVPIAENESAVAQEESEVEKKSEILPHIAENESEVVPIAEDEFEVASTIEDESEVVPVVEYKSEVPPIDGDESHVPRIAENISEVAPIAESESEVVLIADNESVVSQEESEAENKSEMPLIAENGFEVAPLVEDKSERRLITEDEFEVASIMENESEVVPLAEDESEVPPIVVDVTEVAPTEKDESEVVPTAEDESDVALIAEDDPDAALIAEDVSAEPPIAEDKSEAPLLVENESEVHLISAEKHEVFPIVVVNSEGRRVVVPLLQLPSVVNESKDPPRIDQSYSSDLHIESRDSFITGTGTGTHSVDYDHWKSRDDSLYEDSRSGVYEEEGSSQYSSNLKPDSMVFLSQALLDEVSYDMVKSAIASSVPATTSPYALTMSFPVNFFVPILTSADQMIAIAREQQISNTQYATYMLDIKNFDDLVVTIYNDLPGMEFEDMLVPENLVFQSELDENFLLHLSNSVGWGRFSETDADMSSCYLRGSMIRIDDILKLVLRLWHNFISWTVQTVSMHATLIEVVESALCETLGVVSETTDTDHTRSWEEDMLALLDSGRKLHKKFIAEIVVKDELKGMLEKWEFDPRRSVYNDRSVSLGLEVAEDIVLVEFRTLSMELYEKLCEQSIDLPADESNEFKLSKYVLHDLMDHFRPKIVDVIIRFYENLDITSFYNSTVEDYLKSSIDMIFQFELQLYRTHDWNAYYKKRGQLFTLLESSSYEGDIMKSTKDAFDDFIFNDDDDHDDDDDNDADNGADNGDRKHASAIRFISSFKNELGTLSKIEVTLPTIEDKSDVVSVTENKSEVPITAVETESEEPPIAENESEMLRSDFDFRTIDIVQNKGYMDLAFGDDLDDDDDDESIDYQYSKGWSQSQGSSPGSMHSNLGSSPLLLDPTSSP